MAKSFQRLRALIYKETVQILRDRRTLILFFALPLAVSAADEIHQMFLPGRSADGDDWLAGAVGVAIAWWLLRHTGLRKSVTRLRQGT